jgi:septal ring factor EnvC (AmiA/AmiB activator)
VKTIRPAASLLAVIFASILILPVPPAGLRAQSPAPKQDLSDFEQRLARINGQIADIKARIDTEAKQESTVLSHLARINLNKDLIERELSAQNLQMEKARADLAGLQSEVRDLTARLEKDNAAVGQTLVTLYKFGRLNFLELLLQAQNFEAYITESKRLALLARYQEDRISTYLKTLAELGETQSRLEAKKKDIAEILRATNLKKQELEAEQRKNADLVREIRKNRTTHEQTIQELRDRAEQLQVVMQKIISEEWTLPSAFVPLYEKKGHLAWPLAGRIITSFGLQKHPVFNTFVMNNGVEIAPGKDKALILAVHAGKVVYADYFQGYGNLLIVDHGMMYYTLYGHCSQFLVNLGDMVRAEQPIALVGDSGSLSGECLYFEVRYKTRALDPLQWLKRR